VRLVPIASRQYGGCKMSGTIHSLM